ncbi:MAG: CarD family transcriptional regulator [Clostridiaceae bacterium]|nr:CarD family transcriptional regulator [Clostridiaceae bacterium]
MFKIGDQIVYPNQGVGVIDKIEEKQFKGDNELFYTIHLLNNSLKLLMPENRISQAHIRLVTERESLDNLLNNISTSITEDSSLNSKSCKDRLESNNLKLKSGTLKDSLEVCYNLSKVKKEHPLNSSENQMFNKTKKILIEEISLVKNITKLEATDILEKSILQ